MEKKGVTTALQMAIDEVELVISQLNDEAARFRKNREYAKAKGVTQEAEAAQTFEGKVEDLRAEWEGRLVDDKGGKPPPPPPPHRRHPPTILEITFPDGLRICKTKAAQAFVQALEKIGIEKVRQLGKRCAGVPLVADHPVPPYVKSYKRCGKYYVMTQSSTKYKREILQDIAGELGLKLHVQILPRTGKPAEGRETTHA